MRRVPSFIRVVSIFRYEILIPHIQVKKAFCSYKRFGQHYFQYYHLRQVVF
jgi:hypothetical protein